MANGGDGPDRTARFGIARISVLIGAIELRRSVRALWIDRTALLSTAALVVAVFLPVVAVGSVGAYVGARTLEMAPAEHGDTARVVISGVTVVVWIAVTTIATIRGLTHVGDLEGADLLLLATSPRPIVLGLLGGEVIRYWLWFVPAGMAVSIAAAVASGRPAVAVAGPVLVVLLTTTAAPAGLCLGLGLRHVATAYRPVIRLRLPLLVLIGGGYVLAAIQGWLAVAAIVVTGRLMTSPLVWPAEVLALTLPGLAGEPRTAVAGVGLAGLVGAILVAGAQSLAAVHWYRDPIVVGATRYRRGAGRLERTLDRFVDRPRVVVCIAALRRTRRRPIRTAYVAYPALGILFVLAEIARTGTVSTPMAIALSLYVVWGSGALFTLNPIGDMGPVLTGVLSAPIRGRDLMAGLATAGLVVGLPAVVTVSVLGGLLSPLSGVEGIAFVLVSIGGAVVAPFLALGVGALAPRFGAVEVTHKREAVMPSKLAFGLYTALLTGPMLAGLALAVPSVTMVLVDAAAAFEGAMGLGWPVSSRTLRFALLWPVVAGVALAVLAYRIAIRRFDRYTID